MLNETEIRVLKLINEYGKHTEAMRQSRLNRREYFSITMKLYALGAISYYQNRIHVTDKFKKYLE